jgi:hypothetical protein
VDLLQPLFFEEESMIRWGQGEMRSKTGGAFGGSKPGKKKMVRKGRITEEQTATVAMPGTVGVKLFKELHKRNIIEQLKNRRFDKMRGFVAEVKT